MALTLAAALGVFGAAAASGDAFERTWCEFDTGEFSLVTDHTRAEAEDIVNSMRVFRPVAEQFLPGTPNRADPPLTVVAFSRPRDFRRAIGISEILGYMQPSFGQSLMVVGPDPNAFRAGESLLHEYVHYLLRTRAELNIPVWYDEGLASMLSTMRFEPNGEWTTAVVGDLSRDTLRYAIAEAQLSLDDVLDAEDLWNWAPMPRRGFYAYATLLVHRLTLGQAEGLDDYRPALTATLRGDAPSLSVALDTTAGRLDRELERYLRHPASESLPLEGSAPADVAYRCLDDAEATRQLSLAIMPHNPEEAARQLERQVGLHPDDAALWTVLSLSRESLGNRDESVADARRAVELAPDDVSAKVQLASALAMGCILEVSETCWQHWREAVPLLRDALHRDPSRLDATFVLGLAYLYTGRAGDALNYLRIANKRQPWAPHVNFYLGESYRLIGDKRAAEHLQRARRWSPIELWRKLSEAALAEL